jgi:hypothetical protein
MSTPTSAPAAATHDGPAASIPASAPPGLRLLAALFAPFAALDPAAAHAAIAKHCAPAARVRNNGTPPAPLIAASARGGDGAPPTQDEKRRRRGAALARVERELGRAVEVGLVDGAREVWWHGRTGHVFRADAEAAAAAGTEPEVVWMAEAGMWRIERVPAGVEGEVGVGGWWVVDMMSWHDRTGIRQKRAELGV